MLHCQILENGTTMPLNNASQDAYARSKVINNGDVYVAGEEYNGTKFIAKYWKNGIPVVLEEEYESIALSIFVTRSLGDK